MGNPVFSEPIAELTPIPVFIQRDGLISLPLQLHLVDDGPGRAELPRPDGLGRSRLGSALTSAAAPVRLRDDSSPREAAKKRRAGRAGTGRPRAPAGGSARSGCCSSAAFSLLSWQATRNSHQFAAVVGRYGLELRRVGRGDRRRPGTVRARRVRLAQGLVPRLAAWSAIGGLFSPGSRTGRFYDAARRGRTIGLGEQPLWYPHEAVKFAGGPGMPDRFLGFHIGHASLMSITSGRAARSSPTPGWK